MGSEAAKYVIVGAGLAGMATAWGLTQQGESSVLVLEKEEFPGMHSSGRNAAMIRQVVSNPKLVELAREGAKFFGGDAPGWDQPPPFRRCGSLLAASGAAWEKLRQEADTARRAGVELELWDSSRVERQVPCARGGKIEGGVYCPTDGVTDTDGLIQGYWASAKSRGARLETGCEVLEITVASGRVTGVKTGRGWIETRTVVNAGGPWASMVAGLAGAPAIEFTPLRRHLYYTGQLDWIDPAWPFVWDVGTDVYFRPESAGLLLSPCDETPSRPVLPVVDPAVQDLLAEKLAVSFPALLEVPIARSWAGLRTFAPDRMFVIGWDPLVEGFYWVAGLGGHGVTTSPAVGRFAAGELAAGQSAAKVSPFSPERFV
ncbi:MAG: FAD-dependent oxidoreductase [Candidatus Glassbacteria bacterium]